MRTELGWSSMNEVGTVDPEALGLQGLYGAESNMYAGGMIGVGFDARLQYVRTGRPPAPTERIVIPMQLQPYLSFEPLSWLDIYGGFNISMVATDRSFPGQFPLEAAVQLQPGVTAPLLRLGYIQPTIGMRHDDHTVYSRREIARFNTTIIPPNYAEPGVEIVYEGLSWLSLAGGVFASKHLAEANSSVDGSTPSIAGRAMIWPQLLDQGINGQLGASMMVNGDFQMINLFAGVGLADKASFFVEAMVHEDAERQRVRNVSVMGSLLLAQWLSLNWRYEFALTEHPTAGVFNANAFVAGFEFFPIPSLEIRPEYRFYDDDQIQTGQYTVQLHLFY